jgi:hypothetical protein
MRPRTGSGDGPAPGSAPGPNGQREKEVPMSVPRFRRFRSLLVAWLLAAGLAMAQVATVLADGGSPPYPR